MLALGLTWWGGAQPAAPVPAIAWTRMIWMSIDTAAGQREHGALMVEVRLDGMAKPALMQLDTGCDSDLLNGVPYEYLDRHDRAVGQRQFALSGAAAGSRFADERFTVQKGSEASLLGRAVIFAARHWGYGTGKPLILGILGAAFFEQRVLLLDFAAGRVAMLAYGEELPEAAARRVAFVPLEYRNSKMFVKLTINGQTERYLAFDTGSSTMAVTTTQRRWLEWTGRQPGDAGNRQLKVNSWGREVSLVGAPLKGRMCVGEACVTAPLVFFEPTGIANLDFNRYGFPIDGVFGNVPFDGRFTVVLDVPHRRFGLLEGSLGR